MKSRQFIMTLLNVSPVILRRGREPPISSRKNHKNPSDMRHAFSSRGSIFMYEEHRCIHSKTQCILGTKLALGRIIKKKKTFEHFSVNENEEKSVTKLYGIRWGIGERPQTWRDRFWAEDSKNLAECKWSSPGPCSTTVCYSSEFTWFLPSRDCSQFMCTERSFSILQHIYVQTHLKHVL